MMSNRIVLRVESLCSVFIFALMLLFLSPSRTIAKGIDEIRANSWVEAKAFGTEQNSDTIAAALKTIGSSQRTLYLSQGTWSIKENLTVPENIILKVDPGTVLDIADNVILTNNGVLDVGLYQVFSCKGNGKVVFGNQRQTLYPQWWGASPTTAASINARAIQASVNALGDYGGWTLPPGLYTCDMPVTIGNPSKALMHLFLDFQGSLLFENCSGLFFQNIRHSKIKGVDVKLSIRDWEREWSGIRFSRFKTNNIEITYVKNFKYGIYLDGDYWENAYNNFYLSMIASNKYGLYVNAINGGWNNENNYYGGRFTLEDNIKSTTSDSWGVYFAIPVSNRYDNHRFYGPCFETLHNGMYLGGFYGATQMTLDSPRFEDVDNWIEAAPRTLVWIMGAQTLEDFTKISKMADPLKGTSVTIIGGVYDGADGYKSLAIPETYGGLSFYNNLDPRQREELWFQTKDVYSFQLGGNIGNNRHSQNLDKAYTSNGIPTNKMTYHKNAVIWNSNVTSGTPMGWVCKKSGSTGVSLRKVKGSMSREKKTLTVTSGDIGSLFIGAYFKIDGITHQVSSIDGNSITVFENKLIADVTDAAITEDPPEWQQMPKYP